MQAKLIRRRETEYDPRTVLTVISKSCITSIKIDDIIRISRIGYETVIYTVNGQYRTMCSLREILKDLPANSFFRVHKVHIVSLRHIIGLSNGRIMVGEYCLHVSRYYKLKMVVKLKNLLDKDYEFYGPG